MVRKHIKRTNKWDPLNHDTWYSLYTLNPWHQCFPPCLWTRLCKCLNSGVSSYLLRAAASRLDREPQ